MCLFVRQYNYISFGRETSFRKLALGEAKCLPFGEARFHLAIKTKYSLWVKRSVRYTFGEASFHFNSIKE
jgi:hypothetical protein